MSLLISACARARDCRDTCVIKSLLKVLDLYHCSAQAVCSHTLPWQATLYACTTQALMRFGDCG